LDAGGWGGEARGDCGREMKKEEKRKVVEEAIKYWQPRLRLRDWEFGYDFVDETETGSKYGDLLVVWDKESAIIEICNKCPDSRLESLIVHELLHIHTHRSNITMLKILNTLCSKKITEIIYDDLQIKENIMVDKLARIFIDMRKEKGVKE